MMDKCRIFFCFIVCHVSENNIWKLWWARNNYLRHNRMECLMPDLILYRFHAILWSDVTNDSSHRIQNGIWSKFCFMTDKLFFCDSSRSSGYLDIMGSISLHENCEDRLNCDILNAVISPVKLLSQGKISSWFLLSVSHKFLLQK